MDIYKMKIKAESRERDVLGCRKRGKSEDRQKNTGADRLRAQEGWAEM